MRTQKKITREMARKEGMQTFFNFLALTDCYCIFDAKTKTLYDKGADNFLVSMNGDAIQITINPEYLEDV